MRRSIHSMKIQIPWLATLLIMGLTGSAWAVVTNYTYTGLGVPNTWNDSNNWTNQFGANGVPGAPENAIIPDGFGPSFTLGTTPAGVWGFKTGNMLVTMPSNLNMMYVDPNGHGPFDIGTGGITFTAGGITFPGLNAGDSFTSRGPVNMSDLSLVSADPVQIGSAYWNITTISLAGDPNDQPLLFHPITNWDIRNGVNTTIKHGAHADANFRFFATPNITGGRPNWWFGGTSGDGGINCTIDIQNFTLYGNRLQLDGRRTTYGGSILWSNGGTVDLNTIEIALGGQAGARMAYLALTNTTVYIRGSGTAWNNDSSNAPAFSITNNTMVVFDPTGGVASVDTGSKDRNSVARDPVDWMNNFAFDKIRIGSNDTITLTGDANIDGGGTNALYATSIEGEGTGGTVVLNGHNIYLRKRYDKITFDKSGGGQVYIEESGTVIMVK